jgi:hypothetical protein
MRKDHESAKILKEFGIIFDPKHNISQLGGLAPFLAFLKKGKFYSRLQKEFGSQRARTALQFVLGLIAGARSMVDVGKAGKDPLVKRFLERTVEEVQLSRDIRSFSREMTEKLHDFNVGLSILDFVQKVPQSEQLVFDIDATPVKKFGHQEGVEYGYTGDGQPNPCYQYLFIRLANRNTFLYGTIRGGSAHSQNDFCGYLDRFLPMLRSRWQSAWRADSGYFNEAAFDRFTQNDCSFYIKAPMSEERLRLAQSSPDIIWSPEKDGVSYGSRTTNTKEGTLYREVFKRSRVKEKRQLLLGDLVQYRYDCIATNDLSKEESEIFAFYNGRANIENNIKELKYDYQLGKIVTDDFNANDVITQFTLLAYLLVSHFKQEVLPPKLRRNRLSTLRTHLFGIPGRMLTFARYQIVRIQNVFLGPNDYAEICQRIKRLRSWVLAPPELG